MIRGLVLAALLLFPTPLWAAVPTIVGSGSIASGTGDVTPGIHSSTLTNDIVLIFIETDDESATVSGGSETWVEVADSPQSVTAETRLTVFWARASQDTPTSPTIEGTANNHTIARTASFRGVITTGDPWDVTSGGTEAVEDTTGSITGDATTVADCLVIAAMAANLPDAQDATSFSGPANGDLTSVAELTDNCRNPGNGGCIFTISGEKASAGSYGATTLTLEDAAQKAFMTIALKPPAAGTRRVMVVN
jgi:hypothetical protein